MSVSEKEVQRVAPRGQLINTETINQILRFIQGFDLSEVVTTFLSSGMNVQKTIDMLIRKKISNTASDLFSKLGFKQRETPENDFSTAFSNFRSRERIVEGNRRQGRLKKTDAEGGVIVATGRFKALLIGCNYYGTNAELQGCVPDVYRMKQLLHEVYQFPTTASHMTILTDDQSASEYQPTRENILKGFQWLRDGTSRGDTIVLHFSGHGVQVPSKKGNWWEKDKLDEAILPCDWEEAGHILDQEINQNLVTKLDEGVKLLCVIDCCHSGTAIDLPYTMDLSSKTWQEYENPFKTKGDVVVFTGCQDDQTSADIQTREPAGAMTTAFINSITDNLLKDNTKFTYTNMMDSIHGFMKNNGFSQRPQLNSSQQFPASEPFSLSLIHGNNNPLIGPDGPKIKPPPKQGGLIESLLEGNKICRICQAGMDVYNIVMNQIPPQTA